MNKWYKVILFTRNWSFQKRVTEKEVDRSITDESTCVSDDR